METIEKDGISISMYLNADRSVDLKKIMTVKFVFKGEMQTKQIYPDTVNGKIGTINHQFEYVKSIIKFDQAYAYAIGLTDPPKN